MTRMSSALFTTWLFVMINPFESTITPEPWPRSFRSRCGCSRLKNSSPKNLRKKGSSNGELCGPSPDFPDRLAAMLTTAGFTVLAISTKLLAGPPVTGCCGTVATGWTMPFVGVSGPAAPLGIQPRSDAKTTPMTTPNARRTTGSAREPPSLISALLDFTGIDAHDRLEEFHRFGLRTLERISPDDAAEAAATADSARLFEHVLILVLGPA